PIDRAPAGLVRSNTGWFVLDQADRQLHAIRDTGELVTVDPGAFVAVGMLDSQVVAIAPRRLLVLDSGERTVLQPDWVPALDLVAGDGLAGQFWVLGRDGESMRLGVPVRDGRAARTDWSDTLFPLGARVLALPGGQAIVVSATAPMQIWRARLKDGIPVAVAIGELPALGTEAPVVAGIARAGCDRVIVTIASLTSAARRLVVWDLSRAALAAQSELAGPLTVLGGDIATGVLWGYAEVTGRPTAVLFSATALPQNVP
ncbi:MAG: hypothetical protein RLN75_08655, partial [Longimicrobiales bacterium]